MDRRVWRTRKQGGYFRVVEVVDGVAQSPRISVNKQMFGEQISTALNDAYRAGAEDSRIEHESAAKAKLADLLKEMGHEKAADVVRGAPIS